MEYEILDSTMPPWRGRPLYAQQVNPPPLGFAQSMWDAAPIPKPPWIEFVVDPDAVLPDILATGSVYWVVSPRLIELVRGWTVPFETFPTRFRTDRTSEPQETPYRIFHLMQVLPIINRNTSKMNGLESIESIRLNSLGDEPEYNMVRDTFFRALVFVSKQAKKELERAGITGCSWQATSTFRRIPSRMRFGR